MAIEAQTLNQYVGTDAQGNGVTIVAPDMETACSVYNAQESTDPTIMQCTKRGVKCVLPAQYVTFNSEAWHTHAGHDYPSPAKLQNNHERPEKPSPHLSGT